jgi:ATP-dependent DNA helicase RecG
MGYRNRTFFTRKYLFPLIREGKLQMTQPDKPNSRNQKYIAVKYPKE